MKRKLHDRVDADALPYECSGQVVRVKSTDGTKYSSPSTSLVGVRFDQVPHKRLRPSQNKSPEQIPDSDDGSQKAKVGVAGPARSNRGEHAREQPEACEADVDLVDGGVVRARTGNVLGVVAVAANVVVPAREMRAEDDGKDEVEDGKDADELVADGKADRVVGGALGEGGVNGGAIGNAKQGGGVRIYIIDGISKKGNSQQDGVAIKLTR